MKKNYLKILPVVLLALAIGLSPSFPTREIEGGRMIEIRVEDILIVILGLVWIANFLISGRKKLEKPPLFFPILAWLGIGFLSVLTNWIFVNIGLSRGFFYFLKEIEFFFLYFYLFYHLNPVRDSGVKEKAQKELISNGVKSFWAIKFIIKIWIFLGLVNASWIIFQAISGLKITYYYGPTAFIEHGGSLPSGGFFLIIFTFLFNILLYYHLTLKIPKFKKGILALIMVIPAVGTLTGCVTSFFGFVFAVLVTLLFYTLKKKGPGAFFKIILVMVLLVFIFGFVYFKIPAVKTRLLTLEKVSRALDFEIPEDRASVWKEQVLEAVKQPMFVFFGYGKSVFLVYGESHSQYVRNFVEVGIFGSIIFFILILAILKKVFYGFSLSKHPLIVGLSAGALVATLTMLFISIVVEAFIVVKIAEVYWFFMALTMAALYRQQIICAE